MKTCNICGLTNIDHEEKEGCGLPPKGYVKKRGDNRLITWKGMWDIYTCKQCGNIIKTLRK